jgi:hypothetical protein
MLDSGGKMDRSVVLAVGESFHLKRGKDWIVYAGMPTEDVYSIIQRKTSGYQGFAWNLYYSRRKTDINVDGVDVLVDSVSPDEIMFRVR